MSLLDTKNYATMTELPYSETFQDLFMVDKNSTSNPKPNTQISHTEGKDLVLPATKLRNNCYLNMFNGCTNMNYLKCLATDISASNCTNNWLKGTPSKTSCIFVKAAGVDRPRNDSGIPNGWTIEEE